MNIYWLGAMLDMACILMFSALGDEVALTAGEYNMGGDGQIYIAAFTASIMLNATRYFPPALSLAASFSAAILAVCALSLISILLKVYRGTDILLSSYLVSSASSPIIDALIAGKFRGEGNLLATPFIRDEVASPCILPPSSLTLVSLTAPLLCVLAWLYLKHSETGKRLEIVGASNRFADYAGLESLKTSSLAVIFAYAMHALSGIAMVIGTHRACLSGFENGMGWSAFTVALLSRKNALRIISAAIIFSSVMTLASRYTLTHITGFDASGLIQALFIAAITIASSRKRQCLMQ